MINNNLNERSVDDTAIASGVIYDLIKSFLVLHDPDAIFAMPDIADRERDDVLRNLDAIARLIQARGSTTWPVTPVMGVWKNKTTQFVTSPCYYSLEGLQCNLRDDPAMRMRVWPNRNLSPL